MSGASIKGIPELAAKLKAVMQGNKEKTQRAILQEAYALQAESQKECPVDTGRLRASAYTRPTEEGARVGYTSDYSVYVHERVDIPHKVGKAKFLEDPMIRMQEGYAERVAARVKGGE